MDQRQEREVARGLRMGSAEAWHALYDAHARQVWGSVARLMGPNAAGVADVVQETFLAAARSARQYDPQRGSLWMWLSGIARRQVALYYRRERRHVRVGAAGGQQEAEREQVVRWLEDRETGPTEACVSAEVAMLVRAALTELPAEYETLLTAKYIDGVSVEEIAGVEQVSSTAIRSKLARARRAFRLAFTGTTGDSHGGRAGETHES